MHAERLPMRYVCTKFGVDSSSRFPFTARTNRQTRPYALCTTAAITAGVGKNGHIRIRSHDISYYENATVVVWCVHEQPQEHKMDLLDEFMILSRPIGTAQQ